MLDIGIDFGSTYTMVSVYRRDLAKPEIKSLTELGARAVPTMLVCRPDGSRVRIGEAAKGISIGDFRRFRAFKMMLAEDDADKLRIRGFMSEGNGAVGAEKDNVIYEFSPRVITKYFLKELIGKVLEREDEKEIGSLVIGAPEVWYDAFSTIDGRTKLRNICRELPFFGKNVPEDAVKVVSEPAAAGAYFAYNYRNLKKKPFTGNFLLIDYGGGTLDISLSEITGNDDRKDNGNLELRVLNHAGIGENEEKGRVGKAGIVYMESLAREIIHEAFPDLEDIPLDGEFYEVVDTIEKVLTNNTDIMEDTLSEYGVEYDGLTEERLGSDYFSVGINYSGKKLNLTYQAMAKVYDEVIRPVFNEKMLEFIDYMDYAGINWRDRTTDHFKIVLVGGFGKFYFVKEQMEKTFEIGHNDKRQKDIMLNDESREEAISLGCALLSADVIRIKNTAPLGIGVMTRISQNGRQLLALSYGLRYHNEIEYNKEYLQTRNANINLQSGKSLPELVLVNDLDYFLVDLGKGPVPVVLKHKFLERIRSGVPNGSLAYFGFSIDNSGVITFYVHECDIMRKELSCKSFELSSYKDLFDTQSPDEDILFLIRESLTQYKRR